ncbi:hypothetical protein KR51_00016920 [Rubidibacter lacunae KORDI 51-2]|uniref:Uncharacterized protein n=1 Tax=Rubidibacter lacunae KORDI 51-2 TaxID=582515 RepID=U5DM89_9CHRO|nr:hypothetical protein KR51_00016920 [Rubidibacter lacunae KORDI 51-2]
MHMETTLPTQTGIFFISSTDPSEDYHIFFAYARGWLPDIFVTTSYYQ